MHTLIASQHENQANNCNKLLPSRSHCNIMRNSVLWVNRKNRKLLEAGRCCFRYRKKIECSVSVPSAPSAVQAGVVPILLGNVATGPHPLLLQDAKEPLEHYLLYCTGTAPLLITTALPAERVFFIPWNDKEILRSLSSNPVFSFNVSVVILVLLQKRTMLILNPYQNCIYRCILSHFKVSWWLKISILRHLMLFSFSAPVWWCYINILEEYSRIWARFSSHLDFANDWKAFPTPNLSSVVQQKSFPLSILVSKHKE